MKIDFFERIYFLLLCSYIHDLMGRYISPNSDKNFEYIFNHANGGIALVSLKGDWVKVNKSIELLLGYTKEELHQLTFQDVTHKDDLDLDVGLMNDLLKGRINNYQIEKRYFHKKGHIVWALLSVSLVRDEHNKPQHFISQVHDITEQKTKSLELAALLDVTKEQNSRLSNFANIVTHNLRTYASNMKTLFEFIEEEEVDIINKNQNFEFLKESILNLHDTVSHLTEIAKIRAVPKEKLKQVNLKQYVKNGIYNVSALTKNINYSIENFVKDEHYITVIPAYLDSIILNLLTNAIKYRNPNRAGKVVLNSYIEGKFVVLSVSDNGMGIDLHKHADHVFQMYKTFHNNEDANGLGLFITRNQIESMGGTIELESKVDECTTFYVSFKNAMHY